jgi:hypothetical protein
MTRLKPVATKTREMRQKNQKSRRDAGVTKGEAVEAVPQHECRGSHQSTAERAVLALSHNFGFTLLKKITKPSMKAKEEARCSAAQKTTLSYAPS